MKKPVSLSIEASLLNKVDAVATNRSKFVTEAIEQKLGMFEVLNENVSVTPQPSAKAEKLSKAREVLAAQAAQPEAPFQPPEEIDPEEHEKWLKRRILQPDLRTLPVPIARREAMKERQHGSSNP